MARVYEKTHLLRQECLLKSVVNFVKETGGYIKIWCEDVL